MVYNVIEEGSNSIHVEKMTQKPHHDSWFTRKFLRRTPSTYNFKAKITFKPLARKKSFSSIRSHSDKASTNILKGKSLDEMSLLGGTQILVLPADFAVGKLELPTCLSATAAYILKHGKPSCPSFN